MLLFLCYKNAIYLDGALGSDDTVDRRFCKRIESPVRSTHKVWFQQVPAIAVILEFALVQLEGQIGCLKVERNHLRASVPKHLKKTVNNNI